jgi:replicative DNA helicase
MLHSEASCVQALDRVSEDDFSDMFNRDLFLLIHAIFTQGIRPTSAELIKEGRKLGFVKGPEEIEGIRQAAEHYIDDENIGYWIGKVKEASKGRAMQKLLQKYSRELDKTSTDIPDLIRNASGEILSLAIDVEGERFVTGKEIGEYGQELIEKRVERYRQAQEDAKSPGVLPLEGVPTGLPTLDNLSLGYKPGDLILLAAQTGHGKTAFAMQTSKAVCIDGGKPLFYLNTEMNKDQITTRWGSMLSNQLAQQLRIGSLTNAQLAATKEAYKRLIDSNFITYKLASPTASRVDILTRKAKLQYNIEMMILDYVGRMQKLQKGLEEWQVLEQIVKSMKELASSQDIAIMVLAQLNDNDSLQGAKRMRNECDMVLKLLPVDDDTRNKIEAKLKKKYEEFNYTIFVDKSRDFETGRYIPLVFDLERQQIREARETGVYNTKPSNPLAGWEDIAKEVKA